MSSIASMNSATLGQMLNRDIADIIVLIAKNIVLGNDAEGCAQILGVNVSEIEEIQATTDYKDVHLLLASHHNQGNVDTDLTYDEIEQKALRNLNRKMDNISDPDKLVRIAVMANRAVRRQSPNRSPTLDPGRAGQQVQLTLSRRMVERLQNGGSRTEDQQISITGPFKSPTFEQVSDFLGAKPPRIEENFRPESSYDTTEVTLDQLLGQVDKYK